MNIYDKKISNEIIRKIFFVLTNLILMTILAIHFAETSIFFCGMIFCVLFLYAFRKEKNIFGLMCIIYALIIAFTLIVYYSEIDMYLRPYYVGGSDDATFEEYARSCVAQNWITPFAVYKHYYWYNSVGFVWILSLIMRFANLFGTYHTFVGRLFNIYLLMSLAVMVYRFFKEHYGYNSSYNKKLLCFAALFPNMIYISTHVFRDVLSVFLVFYSFCLCEKINNKENLKRNVTILVINLLIATFVRKQNFMFIAIAFILTRYVKRNISKIKMMEIVMIAIGGIAVLGTLFREALVFQESFSEGLLEATQEGMSQFIWNMPLFPGVIFRAVYGLVSPFPAALLQIFHMFDSLYTFTNVMVAFGTIVQIFAMPYMFLNITKNRDAALYLYGILFIIVTGLTFAFRHFAYLYPFFWILVFRQYGNAKRSFKRVCFLTQFVLLAVLGTIYILL